MRFALPFVAALVLVGCNNYTPYLPDGGRARVNCDSATSVKAAVTVVDADGNPAPEAVVVTEYTSYDETERIAVNERGVALIGEKFGPGVVRIHGQGSNVISQTAELTFNGSECASTVTPNAITLQLR